MKVDLNREDLLCRSQSLAGVNQTTTIRFG